MTTTTLSNPLVASLIVTIVSAATGLIYYSPVVFGGLMQKRLKTMSNDPNYLDESLHPQRVQRVLLMSFVFLYIAALAYAALADGYNLLIGSAPWQLAFLLWIFFGAAFRVITFHFKFDRQLVLIHVFFWSLVLIEYALLFPALLHS